ncbi:CTU1 protein, partial [Aramus guarauna]|nr:CTU1 protein [Aramus guarauna]
YREASLRAVRRGRGDLPLLLVSHREVFGWSVDEVGRGLGGGSRHNADDIAETVLMNFLRGDVARLRRAATEATGTTGSPAGATTAPGEATEATTSPTGASKTSGTTKSPTEATEN